MAEPSTSGDNEDDNVPEQLPGGDRLARGAALGRYLVLGPVGAGAMGQVYLAYDATLDRKVALKVLHVGPRHGPETAVATERIVREAKALARVAHPNVVAVHDVGTVDGVVFVAMERVRGATLAQWCAAQPRAWREVVRVFAQAGAGLAAAHGAGLVHRDFKLSNVVVGDDGRVRVLDFGLARAAQPEPDEPASAHRSVIPIEPAVRPDTGAAAPGVSLGQLTHPGALVGTPAYMAPEQLRGRALDARADQYSFCVALHESLHGVRPYNATGLVERLEQGEAGPPDPPKASQIPAWLTALVARGLAPDREDRWSSMDALLGELRDRQRGRRSGAYLVLSAALAAGLAGGVGAWLPARPTLCQGARERLDPAWGQVRQARVHTAIAGTEVPWASETWVELKRRVDDYADGWVAMHTEACTATRLRGDQSDEALGLRMQCLYRRATELGALTEALTDVTAETMTRVVDTTFALAPLADCADLERLDDVMARPSDPAKQVELDAIEGEIARLRALRATGDYATGLARAGRVVERAEAAGYRPLEAEAWLAQGRLQASNSQDAIDALYRALWAAQAGGDDRTAIAAATELANSRNDDAAFDDAERWMNLAAALLERHGGDPNLGLALARVRAETTYEAGRYESALEQWDEVVAATERMYGEGPRLAADLGQQSSTLLAMGRLSAAERIQRRSVALFQRTFGPEHPELAEAIHKLAAILTSQDRLAQAHALEERVLAIRTRAYGSQHFAVAISHANLANTLIGMGEAERAIGLLERAVRVIERSKPTGPQLPVVMMSLANARRMAGHGAEAAEGYAQALALSTTVLGPSHPTTAMCQVSLAAALLDIGEPADALEHARHALAVRRDVLGVDSPKLAFDYARIGQAHLALGDRADAAVAARSGLRVVNASHRATQAELQFVLARALWDSDAVQARGLLTSSGQLARGLGVVGEPLVEELDAWRSGHPD